MPNRSVSKKAGLVVSFMAWLALYQFSKEIFEWGRPLVYEFYFTAPGKLLLLVFKDTLHFTADNPDFWIKILFSLGYIISYLVFMGLYFGFREIRPLLISVFAGFLVLSIGLECIWAK
jgi:hypothetical protein